MTGTQRINGPAGNPLSQIGRYLVLAGTAVVGLFVLFLFASVALIAVGVIACIALLAVAVFWTRAKLTGRPFGPRAMMDARMAEVRRQMEAQMGASMGGAGPFAAASGAPDTDGPVIDLEQTPQGWTVER